MLKYWLALILLLIHFVPYSQTDIDDVVLEIYYGSENNRIRLCEDSVAVAPEIKIQGADFEFNQGIRIAIANYYPGEDTLVYYGNLRYYWNNEFGYLELAGVGTTERYENEAKKVYYKNLKEEPQFGDRQISITLKDANYLPFTGHFYQFISNLGVTWVNARNTAATMTYYGLQGYLATITSAEENEFIAAKVSGVGWIGASDRNNEGEWEWVTGPESGTLFWTGGLNGSGVPGQYSNWADGEPNAGPGEDYGHLGHPRLPPKTWNDEDNESANINSPLSPKGFIVEYGGMDGDPELRLFAATIVEVNEIAFSDERSFEICEGESVQLNNISPPPADNFSYLWLPGDDTNDPNIYNPMVTPVSSTVYTSTGKWGECEATAEFEVTVKPKPVHSWEPQYVICEDASIILDPGTHTSYLWDNDETSQTITVSEEGWYKVQLTNEFECTNIDSTNVKISTLPQLDYGELDSIVCGSKQQKLNLSFKDVSASTHLISLDSNAGVTDEFSLNPVIVVNNYGRYSFLMEIEDQYRCGFIDTLNIEFHNQPTADFMLDESECAGYNLKVNYIGSTFEDAEFNWLSNGDIYRSETNLRNLEIPLGYGELNRTVGLLINEQGCMDSSFQIVTVKPIIDIWTENGEGCTPLDVKFNFNTTEKIESFLWGFGDGEESAEEKPMHTYINSGLEDMLFDVQLKVVSAEGCKNNGIISDKIVVHPSPSVDFSFDEGICYNETSSVWYEGSGTEDDYYVWDLSNFQPGEILKDPGNTQGPLEFKRSSEPYVNIGVQLVSNDGCSSEPFSKTFTRKPIFNVDLDKTEGCMPLVVEFIASTSDSVDSNNFSWDFGNGFSEIGENVMHEFVQQDRNYNVAIMAKSNLTGCMDTMVLTEAVYVYPQPAALFIPYPPSATVSNPVIQFDNRSLNSSYFEWDFNDNSAISEEQSPYHSFPGMGFYSVILSASNEYGCVDTITQEVTVALDKLYPPTAFSPNATLEEDREFRIYAEGVANESYHLLIFNRWGEIVFESKSQEAGWTGKTKKNNYAPAGVYTWVIQFQDFVGKKHKQQGTVTLLF